MAGHNRSGPGACKSRIGGHWCHIQSADNQRILPDQVDMTNIEAFYLLEGKYIDATRDEVLKQYGSINDYMKNGLGLSDREVQALAQRLLK